MIRKLQFKHRLLSLMIVFLKISYASALTLNVGETYTCDLGSISYLKSCVWTTSDTKAVNFVGTVSNYSTRVTVKALSKPTYATPVTIHCQYYYYDLDPTTGRYTYLRSGYKDWSFFIHEIVPSGISVYPLQLNLYVGESYSLRATVTPANAPQDVQWYSTNGSIVSVSSSGFVKALSTGVAYVRAKTSNGLTAECYVTVASLDPTGISISPSSVIISQGNSQQLMAVFSPNGATADVYWSSNNTSVASVNSSGVVTAVGEGTTKIQAKTDNGLFAFCDVTVPKLPLAIQMSSSLSLGFHKTCKLEYSFVPSDALADISWKSDDLSIATVTQKGEVKAVGVGRTYITATSSNGIYATCLVSVPIPSYRLLMWINDSETGDINHVAFDFEDQPIVTFDSDSFYVHSQKSEIQCEAKVVQKFTLEDVNFPTVLTKISTMLKTKDERMSYKGSWIKISNCRPKSRILVYDISGLFIDSVDVGEPGTAYISLQQYPKGIYIIKTQSSTFKVTKK